MPWVSQPLRDRLWLRKACGVLISHVLQMTFLQRSFSMLWATNLAIFLYVSYLLLHLRVFLVIKKCLEFWSHWSWGVSLSRSSTPRQTSPEVKPLKVAIGCQHWCIDPWRNSSMPLQWYADLLNLYVLSRQSTTSFAKFAWSVIAMKISCVA